jgi:hypothetical protein
MSEMICRSLDCISHGRTNRRLARLQREVARLRQQVQAGAASGAGRAGGAGYDPALVLVERQQVQASAAGGAGYDPALVRVERPVPRPEDCVLYGSHAHEGHDGVWGHYLHRDAR